MLEILDIAGGLIEAVRAWRLSLCVAVGFFAGVLTMSFLPAGMARGTGFASIVIMAAIVGMLWQRRRRRSITKRGC